MIVDNKRLNITQEINGNYQGDSPIYDIAGGYIKTLKYVKYTAMGLNWDILVPVANPNPWLIEHFLKKTSIPQASPAVDELNLIMKFILDGNTTSFQLTPCLINSRDKSPMEGVRVRANTHYDHVGSKEIHEILQTWKTTQQNIKEQINKLIH